MFEIENRHAPKNRKTNKINNKLQENTKKSLIFAGAAAIIVFIISYIYILQNKMKITTTLRNKKVIILFILNIQIMTVNFLKIFHMLI